MFFFVSMRMAQIANTCLQNARFCGLHKKAMRFGEPNPCLADYKKIFLMPMPKSEGIK